jgi:arabinofuranan 3-O-arabinosyltransferase
VPTQVTVSAGGASQRLAVPPVADAAVAGSVVDVPLTLARPLTGRTVRITVDTVRLENTKDYYTQSPSALPIGIAEVGITGLAASPVPAQFPTTCRDDLLTVDGSPVWVSITGTTAAALDRQPLPVTLCGPDAGGLHLGPGSHTLDSTWGGSVGLDIDQLALASAAGGGPATLTSSGQVPAPATPTAPHVAVDHQTSTALQLTVSHVSAGSSPFVLVLGQSINTGWEATVGGASLGQPVLVDGFANGWQVDPAIVAGSIHHGVMTVQLRWAPQKRVNEALIASALAIVACLALAFVPWRRRRRRRAGSAAEETGAGERAAAEALVVGEPAAAVRPRLAPAVDDEPELVTSFRSDEVPASLPRALVIAVAIGLGAGIIAPPFTGLVIAVATFAVLRVPRLRLWLGLAAAALVVAAGGYIVIRQGLDSVLANGGWPGFFGLPTDLAWAGVMFLMTDAVIEVIQRRSGGRRPVPEPSDGDPPDHRSDAVLVSTGGPEGPG